MTETLPAASGEAAFEAAADMAALTSYAFELGDLIKHSAIAAEYAYWKERVDRNGDAQQLIREFARAKEQFADCERFGRFHPDYNEALDRVYAVETRLNAIEPVRRFKDAEAAVDQLLHEVSLTIARSVSETIKVPDNDPNPKAKGCGGGGSCSCGSGGCG
ncbi:YlbF family regulator [Cohnella nanjingensis]|uniref:YlbF family regulator n=1 Tax=Cohnella nanjingensis TaxID=1387779 RepID=A0A7X0RRL6_9BACL|nr:YlbF family regulator [Cohnella nanjingensis]MBB6671145.1 YlbF family regulator [Cohnella nanjingensis]